MSTSEVRDNAAAQANRATEEPRLTSSYLDGNANKPNGDVTAGGNNNSNNSNEEIPREDGDNNENVPTVIVHVRQNFGVLAPVIEPYIYRSGYITRSPSDVYLHLSRNYAFIVDSAMKQVGYEKFMMQMQVMLTQILLPEFGADTDFLVNTILSCNDERTLFVSLLSRSVLSELVNYAQQVIQQNMYYAAPERAAAAAAATGSGGNGRGGMDNNGAGGNYYRGSGQQNYRNGSGGNNAMREYRSGVHNSTNNSAMAHQDGAGAQRPYRSSCVPTPQGGEPGREHSGDDPRASNDVLSQREESGREWATGQRGGNVATPNPNAPVDLNTVAVRGSSAGGMSQAGAARADAPTSRPSSALPAAASVMPRHNHFVTPQASAAGKPIAMTERGVVAGMPQHHFLPQRSATGAGMAGRLPTPASASVSQNSMTAPVPSMMRASSTIMAHNSLHSGVQQQQSQLMNNGGSMPVDWQGGNANGNSNNDRMSPITPAASQRTVTPPSPQYIQQQQQPVRTMNIPAPLSVQRRAEEKNAAAAAVKAASSASGNATSAVNESAPATRNAATSQATATATATTAAATTAALTTVFPAPRGLQVPLVHHQHHMPITHHHHHHHVRLTPTPMTTAATAGAAPAAQQKTAAVVTHSPPPPNTMSTATSTVASTIEGRTGSLSTTPAQPLRGVPRFPAHHHHHHSHLMPSRLEAGSALATTPPTVQQQQQALPQQQQEEAANVTNGAWPNAKEELRSALLSVRVSEKAVTEFMTLDSASIEELLTLDYRDFEKRLRPVVTVLLDRQRIRGVLLDRQRHRQSAANEAPAPGQVSESGDLSSASAPQKSTNGGAGEESSATAAATGSGLSGRPLSIAVAAPSQVVPSPHSSPTSKSGVQVPQPRTKMQQQQQQQLQQNVSGSPAASPADVSYASSELESSRRENSTKAGSPSGYANANGSSNIFQRNNSTHSSNRPDDLVESREEEQRRGGGRRGGKRGAARGGTFSTRVCKYYNTPEGCQYGDKCHYVHSGK